MMAQFSLKKTRYQVSFQRLHFWFWAVSGVLFLDMVGILWCYICHQSCAVSNQIWLSCQLNSFRLLPVLNLSGLAVCWIYSPLYLVFSFTNARFQLSKYMLNMMGRIVSFSPTVQVQTPLTPSANANTRHHNPPSKLPWLLLVLCN